jgi:hypothetical protein
MQWASMREPLWRGMQAFRISWPEDAYVMVEDPDVGPLLFTGEHPEGREYQPTDVDLSADDWAATGPSGM